MRSYSPIGQSLPPATGRLLSEDPAVAAWCGFNFAERADPAPGAASR